MAHFSQKDVLIVCSCGSLRPITRLFFCRHCVVLRCGYCVSHEIDSIYCSSCQENLASSEAKLKKNRCGSCFECPYCFHALSIRATVSKINATTADNSQTPPKTTKSYYLACFSCRWTSRDVKIPDQPTTTSSNWPEHENQFASRIFSLIEYYKVVSLRERLEKEKKVFYLPRRGYQHFSEKFGLTAMIARKRAGLPQLSFGRDELSALPEISPSVASEKVDPLPDNIFSKPIDVTNITTLRQRYVIPDLQPESISELFPMHKHLFSKRSHRCRSCLHNIFKPEYSPASIKFKIYLAAYYYVPEIRLMKKEVFKPSEQKEVLIRLCNPAEVPTHVKFIQIKDNDLNADVVDNSNNSNKSTILGVDQNKMLVTEKSRLVNVLITGLVDLPEITINLLQRDDPAEYDDNIDSSNYQDNPKIIVWRKGNKVILKLLITANDNLKEGDEVIVCFIMRYIHRDKLLSALGPKEEKNVNVDIKYILNVGTVNYG